MLISVTEFAKKVQRTLIEIRDLFREVFATIANATKWMTAMEARCNEQMGGPYKKCKNALSDAEEVHATVIGKNIVLQ